MSSDISRFYESLKQNSYIERLELPAYDEIIRNELASQHINVKSFVHDVPENHYLTHLKAS